MQNTKTKRVAGMLSASALALGLVAMATSAQAGVVNSKHNMSAYMGGTSGTANVLHVAVGEQNNEICIFCHTPHGSNQSVTAPLWNKNKPSTTYTMYNSGTMQADTSGQPSFVSLACLACHDGTQAMDNIVNAQGGDGYSPTGGGASGLTLTWSMAGAEVNADGFMLGNGSNSAYSGTGTVAMLSPDLSNDHPVGIAYCGGGATNGSSATCNDTFFAAPTRVVSSGSGMWSVGNSNALIMLGQGTVSSKGVRLYGTATAGTNDGAASTNPTVECGSCHDPHTTDNQTFLRVNNSGSALCLTCHTK